MFRLRKTSVAALAAGVALAFAAAASADVINGGTFTLNSGDPNAVSYLTGNWFVTTPVRCSSGTMHVQMPVLGGPSTQGATWEYWWPEVDLYATVLSGGTFFSGGPYFAANLTTGQQYYSQNGVWHGPYPSVEAIVAPSTHALYAVDDWFELLDANGRVMSQWKDNGFRSSLAYSGSTSASFAYVEGGCLY